MGNRPCQGQSGCPLKPLKALGRFAIFSLVGSGTLVALPKVFNELLSEFSGDFTENRRHPGLGTRITLRCGETE